ncbi:hypothetical protein B0T26DRAFT_706261 [Lasiosphaeria miniovina]|uniref:Uncharacterized protein n=1 Tax=Lasiosphaeria miniovina TaxID=1954250 RepID=A0AA40AWL0_9PEZI|nr:uncharacterized protein B0T26DRAFT_706261 [Lasiosphaeria miniovina]KAK0723362.1 hypothetical protein B0T26DRAFT_706261 [Lasiosphaeria miniovina]
MTVRNDLNDLQLESTSRTTISMQQPVTSIYQNPPTRKTIIQGENSTAFSLDGKNEQQPKNSSITGHKGGRGLLSSQDSVAVT